MAALGDLHSARAMTKAAYASIAHARQRNQIIDDMQQKLGMILLPPPLPMMLRALPLRASALFIKALRMPIRSAPILIYWMSFMPPVCVWSVWCIQAIINLLTVQPIRLGKNGAVCRRSDANSSGAPMNSA